MSHYQQQLLFVGPSLRMPAIVEEVAAQFGLAQVGCAGLEEVLPLLGGHYCALIVTEVPEDSDCFQVIDAVRREPALANLPIALIAAGSDADMLEQAMAAGVTEVFSAGDVQSLADFVAGCARVPECVELGGDVLVVEDSETHARYVSQLCGTLGLHAECCATVGEALESYRPDKFGLLVVDIVLADIQSGIALIRQIREKYGRAQAILAMSGYDDLPRRLLALKSGADDFISKPFSPEEFVWRVNRIFRALPAVGEGLAPALDSAALDSMPMLSPREREIAGKILSGMSDKAIADELAISFWTVRSHIEQIFAKTGALNRRDLMARFIGK